jgi:hypothetical protein
MLDRLCFQSQFSFTPNDFKNCYDMDMIRQSATGVCSTEVSFQNPSENLQPCQEVHEDANSTTIASNHEVELVKFEYQGTGQFYLDPIVTYMEKFFTREPQSISGITLVLQDCRGLCCKDQSCFQQWPLHFAVLNLWTKGQVAFFTMLTSSQAVHWSQQLLDWLHWHFCII